VRATAEPYREAKRFKTVELLVADRDWEPPPPPRFAHDQIGGYASPFPRWPPATA